MHSLNPSSWLAGFFDDASAFPPALVPLNRAVAEHRALRDGEFTALVGSLVVPDVKLPDLIDVLDEHDAETDQPLAITLLVTGGAGAVAPAVRWATRAPVLNLRTIEVALRDEADLAHNARRFLAALDACEDDLSGVGVFLELPRWYDAPTQGWFGALDEIAAAELGVKFRVTDIGPTDLARSFDAALDRELPIRCSGGLTAAVSGSEPGATGFGYLNLLVAARGCLEGEDAAALLSETSAQTLLAGRDDEVLTRTRQWLRGVSTPNVLEVHDDLVDLGLLASI